MRVIKSVGAETAITDFTSEVNLSYSRVLKLLSGVKAIINAK